MDAVYYTSGTLMTLLFLGLSLMTIIFLVRPHLLNRHKRVKKPFSRFKILLVGVAAITFTLFSFGSVMAATEPASVKQARIVQQAAKAAELKSQQDAKTAADAKAEAVKQAAIEAAKPQVKTETKTEPVAFEATTQDTAALAKGQTQVAVAGVNGERTITYSVTYVSGQETAREIVSSEVTKQPVAQVTQIGTYVAPAVTPKATSSSSNSSSSTQSSSVRTGATCKDGSHSNATGSGACSHHGGVAYWLY